MRAELDANTDRVRYTALIPLLPIAALIAFKWNAASISIQKVWSAGVMSTRTDVVSFGGGAALDVPGRALSYFSVIWPALVFGILISAAVRAFVPSEWLVRRLAGSTLSAQLGSAAAGAPLMLCSCCVVSVFTTVYERSTRLGPSLAIMLASPALNPAALALTFLLFAPKIAVARVLMAAPAVFLSGVLIERLFPKHALTGMLMTGSSPAHATYGLNDAGLRFGRSLIEVAVRTLPVLALGVIGSMLLLEYLPADLWSANGFRSFSVIATASIAVPIALPTFFEIPLAVALIGAGAPLGAAAALLFAGPIVNLPSLLALAKSTNWKIATTLAGLIWAVAVFGGLVLNQMAT